MYDGIQLSEAIVKFLNNQVKKENGYLKHKKLKQIWILIQNYTYFNSGLR